MAIVSSYVEAVCASRTDGSRSVLEAAKRAWAADFGLEADDGLVLSEFASEAKTLGEVRTALELCGCPENQLRRSVERCIAKGLLEVTSSARARELQLLRARSAEQT